MTLSMPELLEKTMPPAIARVHLAVGVFTAGDATLGQAAEIASMSQGEFVRELGRRKIPVHYGREEFAEDMRASNK